MSEKGKLRRNFSIQVIEEVFEEQGRCCSKCGRSILDGYEVHHKDGDSSNNNKENCELFCGMCHDAELWSTLRKQKEIVVGELSELVRKAIDGQIAGALMDKTLDAIKMKLSLQKQVANIQLLEAPVTSRVEYSEAIAEYNLKEYVRGVKDGILKGLDIANIKKVK